MSMSYKVLSACMRMSAMMPFEFYKEITAGRDIYFSPGWESSINYGPLCYYINRQHPGAYAFCPQHGKLSYKDGTGFVTTDIDADLFEKLKDSYSDGHTLFCHPADQSDLSNVFVGLERECPIFRGLIGIGESCLIACNMQCAEYFAHRESDQYIDMIQMMLEEKVFHDKQRPLINGNWVIWPDTLAPVMFTVNSLERWQIRTVIKQCGTPYFLKKLMLRGGADAIEIAYNCYPHARKMLQRVQGQIPEMPIVNVWPDGAVPVNAEFQTHNGMALVKSASGNIFVVSEPSLRLCIRAALANGKKYFDVSDTEVLAVESKES